MNLNYRKHLKTDLARISLELSYTNIVLSRNPRWPTPNFLLLPHMTKSLSELLLSRPNGTSDL